MSGILTPGYLRWDGTKYVLDSDIEIVGPAGSAGPTGPVGPAGPPGPFGTASGDLLGTYPGPISVVGLTGINGVVNFGAAINSPTISQAVTGATSGQNLTFKAQDATFFGGNVVLQSGTGSTAGLIQFLVGNNTAAYFDTSFAFRFGPNSTSTITGPNGIAPVSGTDFLYGNSTTGSLWMEMFSGATTHRAAVGVYNYSAGVTSSVNGLSIQAAGTGYTINSYRANGVLEQSGPSTSALVFSKTLGDGTSKAVTGRIWQSGAWGIGDAGTNNTSALAQAGVSGPVINIGANTNQIVTPTTTTSQAIIFNQWNSPTSSYGILVAQGNIGVNLMSATTSVASTITTKFITSQGRRIKVTSTATSPYTILASDEVVSIGNITTVNTTIAVGSNGASLPQGTINVASTTGFPTNGTILVVTSFGPQVVTYAGVSGGTQFTGCSGGTGVMTTGNAVSSLFTVNLPTSPTTGDTYVVKDAHGNAGLNNILVSGNGINISTNSVASTNIAAGSNGVGLPTGTINVTSTTGFPSSGALLVTTGAGIQTVTYSGTTGTSFTGCSGGTGTMSTGGAVSSLGSPNVLVSTNFTQVSLVYNGSIWISSLANNLSPNAGYTSVVNVVSGGSALVVGFDELILCDPTTAVCNVTAPSSPLANMRFTVKDATAKAATNAIIVDGNGKTLENPASPGTYSSPINITVNSTSATWAFDPTRNRYTLV